jgi:hypothetical protein
MEMKLFKVESADTGAVYTIRMDSFDPSITKFKSQLALFVSIPPQDQILLIGPPYRRFSDSQFGNASESQHQSASQAQTQIQRIFLYNRQVLTGEIVHPLETRLPPYEVGTAVEIAGERESSDLSRLLEHVSSPLLRALPDFERQFLKNLKRGEHFISISEQILTVCKQCVREQGVQIDALQAAVSNLRDHYITTKTAFEAVQEKLSTQQDRHQMLLDSFDSDINNLKSIQLHPALVSSVGGKEAVLSIANTGTNMSVTGASGLYPCSSPPLSPSPSSSSTKTGYFNESPGSGTGVRGSVPIITPNSSEKNDNVSGSPSIKSGIASMVSGD